MRLDSRVSARGSGARGVEVLILGIVKFAFLPKLTEFILYFPFKGLGDIRGIKFNILKLICLSLW